MKQIGLPTTMVHNSTQNMLVGIPSQAVERIIDSISFSFHILDDVNINDRILSAAIVIIDKELDDISGTSFNIYDPTQMLWTGNGRVLYQYHIGCSGSAHEANAIVGVSHFIPAGESRTVLLPWVGKYVISTGVGSINPTQIRSLNVLGREIPQPELQADYRLR